MQRLRIGLRAVSQALRSDLRRVAADPLPPLASPRWLAPLPHILVVLYAALSFVALRGDSRPVIVLSAVQAAAVVAAMLSPVLAWWVVTSVMVVGALAIGVPYPWSGATIAALAGVLFLLALRARPAVVVAALTASMAAGLTTALADIHNHSPGAPWTVAVFYTNIGQVVTICGLAALLGGVRRVRRLAHTRLAAREQISAEERARRTLLEERARIARELHDVVAHHITVINVLVGAARTTMTDDPGRAQEVLVTAERTAREAMTEMRQLLHVLRAEEAEASENHAEVGTANLPGLVEQASRSGVPARLEVTGTAVPLPTAVDHAIYRIVQEALTNTRKHAPGARASIRLSYLGDAVEVEVLDDGSANPVDDGVPGYGLGGMAERVALCGGELQTGRRPEGGFRVYARIPVEPVAPERPREAADSI